MENNSSLNPFTSSPEKTETLDNLSAIRNAIRKVLMNENDTIGSKSNNNLLEALARLNDADRNIHQGR